MKFVSLFAGIGGFDLGLERAGHTCIGQVEIDPYCQKILTKHWPHVPKHDDIRTFQGHEFGQPDLITGGYPCQPFSKAGNRQGTQDERHLWPELLRIIRTIRPNYILMENVPGHLTLGFGQVLGQLAESGYDAEWDCIPASAIGAPHQRDRLWIIAYPQNSRRHAPQTPQKHNQPQKPPRRLHSPTNMAHTPSQQSPNHQTNPQHQKPPTPQPRNHRPPPTPQQNWTLSKPPIYGTTNGVPGGLDKHRNRHRAIGNAIIPQIATYWGHYLNTLAASKTKI